MSGSWI